MNELRNELYKGGIHYIIACDKGMCDRHAWYIFCLSLLSAYVSC